MDLAIAQPRKFDIDPTDLRGYSIARAARAVVAERIGAGTRDEIAPFEAEVSRHLSDLYERGTPGLMVPTYRAPPMDTGSGLKADGQASDLYGFSLRQRMFTVQRGAVLLDGLTADEKIARGGAVTVTWIAEDGSPTETEIPLTALTMVPKTVGARIPVTRRLMKQSSQPVDELVWGELVRHTAAAVDRVAVEGNGTTEPAGVASTASQIATTNNNNPSAAEISAAEGKLISTGALGGVRADSVAWVVSSDTWANLRQTAVSAGILGIEDDAVMRGWPVEPFELLTQKWVLGSWQRLVIGYWGAVDLRAEYTTAGAATDKIQLAAWLDVATGPLQADGFVTHD